MDFFIWRPILSWTRKFRMDEKAEEISDIPFFSMLLKESTLANFIARIYGIIIRAIKNKKSEKRFYVNKTNKNRRENVVLTPGFKKVLGMILNSLLILCFIWLFIKIGNLLYSLPSTYYFTILSGAGLTFLRIILVLLLSTIWAVPFAVYVGLSPKRTKFFQPIIQILASFPAPMLYPFALMIFETFGITLGVGSSLLMLLGVQWYVLFNVLAGATLVSEELRDMFRLVGAGRLQTFRDLYFPSIFPYLITGWLTAAGGAWNASIVAEYVVYNGNVIKTLGIGELISESTSAGNFSLLTGSLVVMVIIVVSLNRLVWRNFYALAERKYSFNR
jgi:NitT/TauT family transport system permease protein